MANTGKHLYGPVPSRRLGLSLGVDIVPFKTCTLDCIYCQLGKTTCKTLERKEYVPVSEILNELQRVLHLDLGEVVRRSAEDLHAAPRVERGRPGRPAQLVPGKAQQVRAQITHRDRDPARSLHRVGVEDDAAITAELRQIAQDHGDERRTQIIERLDALTAEAP